MQRSYLSTQPKILSYGLPWAALVLLAAMAGCRAGGGGAAAAVGSPAPPAGAPIASPQKSAATVESPLPMKDSVASPAKVAVPVGPQQPARDPAGILKWSMRRYAALRTFKADCAWSASYGTDAPGSAQRTILYAAPNRFKVEARSHAISGSGPELILTSVSDGQTLTEFGSDPQVMPATTKLAPASLASARSKVLGHPLIAGSILYQFFGGPDRLDTMVDTARAPIRLGADVTLDGEPCRTVVFYAKGLFGQTEIAIRSRDGMVRRIQCDNQPVLEEMKGHVNPAKIPAQLNTTETYTHLALDTRIASTAFLGRLPPGVQLMYPPPVLFGQPAPDFKVTSLGGSPVKLSSLRGKVVLLDFWATWCGPCRKGLPETQKLHNELAAKGLAVMTISAESKDDVVPFLRANGFTFPAYLDTKQAATFSYRATSIPTTVIIDRQGRLSAYMVGLQDPEDVREELKKAGLRI